MLSNRLRIFYYDPLFECVSMPGATNVFAYCVAKPRGGWAARQGHGRPVTIDGKIVKLGGTEGVNRQLVMMSLHECNSVAISNFHAPSSLTTYTSAWNSLHRCARFFN